jgi:hypothetical protein
MLDHFSGQFLQQAYRVIPGMISYSPACRRCATELAAEQHQVARVLDDAASLQIM